MDYCYADINRFEVALDIEEVKCVIPTRFANDRYLWLFSI